MNRKSNITIFCRCLATLLLLIYALGLLSDIFERKDSRYRFQEFYEQQENIDVLFLGTSHCFNAVSPMDLWEQNGIVAYNLGSPGCRIATAYWILKNALQYTTPKLVVLDCAYLEDSKINGNINYMHTVFDSMPLSPTKIQAIWDLYDQKENIARFLFPFSLYHNRWNELEKSDFLFQPIYGIMGFATNCEAENAILPDFTVTGAEPIDNISTQYLMKIIQLCKQQKIDLLFTFLPFNTNDQSKKDAAYIQTLADQHSIPYLGPKELLSCLNPGADFMNNNENNSHLNLAGAHKMSYYLGDYISENFAISDRRQDPAYSNWHQHYSLYRNYALSLLKEQEMLKNYLVGMADQNYSYALYIHDATCLQDELVVNLLSNLEGNIHESAETWLLTGTSADSWLEEATVQINENGNPVLFHNEEPQYCWEVPVASADVFIVVMDKETQNILDSAAFSMMSQRKIS